ncbi:MAG: PilZ domain-containing protein [Geopsychrobacter sp.]|nr:PilZ domain-containing protein [Geopsychrobacter sp.]
MSVLKYLKEYRVVKISLPRHGGESTVVDGVAMATAPPIFEITFLPDQLQPATFDEQASCRITFDAPDGSPQKLSAEVVSVLSETKLQLRLLEGTASFDQKRAYFRVDADLSVSYWEIDNEHGPAKSVQTPVNLSGGGIRIPVKEEMREGSKVGLEIILDVPRPCVIECAATVVRSFLLGGVMQLALRFVDIEEEDRDALVAYCFAEQRKQLRLKVHMMGIVS